MYENSEDIPMSSKSDNVYSNAGQKVQNKEERGYKVQKREKNICSNEHVGHKQCLNSF